MGPGYDRGYRGSSPLHLKLGKKVLTRRVRRGSLGLGGVGLGSVEDLGKEGGEFIGEDLP